MRSLLAASTIAVLGLLLAACGNATQSRPSPSPASPGYEAPSTPAPTPSPAATGAGSATGSPGACTTAQLAAYLANGQGAAGSVIYDLEFKNVSSVSCTLYGNPGVSMVAGSQGTQVGAAATFVNRSSAATVTLAPGQQAAASLQIGEAGNYPQSSCDITTVAGLRVYPPGQTAALFVPVKDLQGCRNPAANLMRVGPVQS